MQKFIIIDGNAIIHRAFHALPPFSTSKGEQTNATFGFASMLLNILNNEKPNYIAVSFDLKGKTFRHEEYEDYKATRQKAPDELYAQIPRIKQLVKAFEIPIYEVPGFEADDVIGTLALQAATLATSNPNHKELITYIATGDMDTLQLVSEHTRVMTPHKGFKETIIYDTAKVLGKYGLNPTQITDMKGLQGDNSDNIKGVAGIGPKTTKTLLQKYGTLENIYEHLEEITPAGTQAKLAEGRDSAFQSKHLATIVTDVPISLDLPACQSHQYNQEAVQNLFSELEFRSLLAKLGTFNRHSNTRKIEESQAQPSLF